MKEQLDDILHGWASRHTSGESQMKDLARSIKAEIAHRNVSGMEIEMPVLIPFSIKLCYAAVGAAAALLVCAFCYHALVSARPSVFQDNAMSFAVIPDSKISTDKALFREMERLFTDNLRWIAQSNGDVGLGVETIQGGLGRDSEPVVVRLTVVSRGAGETAWRPAWSTDVILRGEERVEIMSNRKAGDKLALWVYPLTDGKMAVDTTFSLEVPVQISSRISTVVRRGEPSEMMTMREGGVEYKVFQTVQSLDGVFKGRS